MSDNTFPYRTVSVRYVLRDASGATVRMFRTNDDQFAQRVIDRSRRIHGELTVETSEHPISMYPDGG